MELDSANGKLEDEATARCAPGCLTRCGTMESILEVPEKSSLETRKGAWKIRMVRRKPVEGRCLSDEDPKVDGERCQITKLEHPQREQFKVNGRVQSPEMFTSPRKFETHGYTSGCIGCRSMLVGGCRQGQSPACRARVAESLSGTDKFGRTQQRVNEFVEKATSDAKRGEEDGDGGDDG